MRTIHWTTLGGEEIRVAMLDGENETQAQFRIAMQEDAGMRLKGTHTAKLRDALELSPQDALPFQEERQHEDRDCHR